MANVMPGQSNLYVPSHEATGKMVVDYARNEKKYTVAKWAKTVKVDKDHGLFFRMDFARRAYVADVNGKDLLWRDGAMAPMGRDNTMGGEYFSYRTERYTKVFTLGDKTVDQASFDLIASHSGMLAQQMMTFRTIQAATICQASGNYLSANVFDIGAGDAGNTGRWDVSTTARQDIKRSIDKAKEAILNATYSGVDVDDLYLVMNDETAMKLSITQEIVDMIKQSPDAYAYVKGEMSSKNPNATWNLPPKLYGVNLVIDDTRYHSTARRGTPVASRCLDSDKPFMICSPMGAATSTASPNPAFLTNFVYEDFTVETMKDKNNRLTSGRITDDRVFEITAPQTGVLFTDVLT